MKKMREKGRSNREVCLSGNKRKGKIRESPLYSFFYRIKYPLFAINQSFFSNREVLIKTHDIRQIKVSGIYTL